jgi:hypothetical protein
MAGEIRGNKEAAKTNLLRLKSNNSTGTKQFSMLTGAIGTVLGKIVIGTDTFTYDKQFANTIEMGKFLETEIKEKLCNYMNEAVIRCFVANGTVFVFTYGEAKLESLDMDNAVLPPTFTTLNALDVNMKSSKIAVNGILKVDVNGIQTTVGTYAWVANELTNINATQTIANQIRTTLATASPTTQAFAIVKVNSLTQKFEIELFYYSPTALIKLV